MKYLAIMSDTMPSRGKAYLNFGLFDCLEDLKRWYLVNDSYIEDASSIFLPEGSDLYNDIVQEKDKFVIGINAFYLGEYDMSDDHVVLLENHIKYPDKFSSKVLRELAAEARELHRKRQ